MPLSSLFDLGAIVLAICIAGVPLWYPRYSFFHRNALAGIDHLQRSLAVRDGDDETETRTRTATLEAGDTGFTEIVRTIRTQTYVTGRPVRIELIHVEQDPEYDTLVIGGGDVSTGEEVVLRVEYETGARETLVETPDFSVDRVLNLLELRQWLTTQMHARSHYVTTVLVVLWGTVLVLGIH